MTFFRKVTRALSYGTLAVITMGSAAAQNQCSDFVVQALNQMGANCNATDRNQACYGYFGVDATAVGGENNFFTAPGNITSVDRLQSVFTRPYNPSANEWGIALLRLQANIPGTLPGQNVTFVMIGEASVLNNGGAGAPLQSFVLNTGLGRPTCDGVPLNSVTLQGPQNINVAFNINGANFNIGSTVTFRTMENGRLRVSTTDGRVESNGVVIPAGFSREVDLDEEGFIIEDAWYEPELFEEDDLETLQFLEEFPEDVFAYDADLPSEEDIDYLAMMDFDLISEMDPYLLDDLLWLFGEYDFLPEDLEGVTLDDLGVFTLENLDFLELDEDQLAAITESFGLDEETIADVADAYGLDLDLMDAYLNDDYESAFADEFDPSLMDDEEFIDDGADQDAGFDDSEDGSADEPPFDSDGTADEFRGSGEFSDPVDGDGGGGEAPPDDGGGGEPPPDDGGGGGGEAPPDDGGGGGGGEAPPDDGGSGGEPPPDDGGGGGEAPPDDGGG
ncbi:MAG: hypothetical protein KME04_08730 [Pleurocapsa minor GSE-CHR-MK-17-07R]|jgi:hypothetical protein|nr:hypothetical protein [Pleurocapsa minor GSE-CHR-MK 17-07R]